MAIKNCTKFMNVWLFILLFSFFNSAFASIPNLKSLIAQKNYDEAIQLGQQLKQQHPQSASVLFYTALAYQNNKQFKPAKTLYLQAIKQNKQLVEAYNNLAHIYVTEKQYIKAADTLTLGINAQPSIATAYANLSNIYRHLANKAYQQVLRDADTKKQRHTKLKTQLLASLNEDDILIPPAQKTAIKKPIPTELTKQKLITKATVKTLPSPKDAIIKWAKNWQEKQYSAYIKSYSSTYAPKNLSHAQWLAQRKKRINRPGNIFVSVSNFDVSLKNNSAYVNFDQAYRSKRYSDKVRKRMHLTLLNGQWIITSEVTLSVL